MHLLLHLLSLIPSTDDDIITYGNDENTYLADFRSEIVDQKIGRVDAVY